MTPEPPHIPVRMLNEFVYCPRLAHFMWVQAEMAHNFYTVDGSLKHRRVDAKGKKLPEPETQETVHATSVELCSDELNITARLDLVEGEAGQVFPVDYKRGKRPHVARGVYDPERVQLCAQGLLLKEQGYACDRGYIHYLESQERVCVPFDDELLQLTRDSIAAMRTMAADPKPPSPLEDSPRCPRCSLVTLCLPDELRFLQGQDAPPRPIFAALDDGVSLHVQSYRAYLRKDGMRLVVEEDKKEKTHARFQELSHVALYGNVSISSPALRECLSRQIPVTFSSYGGWFLGHTMGTGHRNVETRILQYRAADDPAFCLELSRSLVAGKVENCRTLLRRNWRDETGNKVHAPSALMVALKALKQGIHKAQDLQQLLGQEGAAAQRYFSNFGQLLARNGQGEWAFDFNTRNRRPPRDPVNALLSFGYAMLTREWTVALSAVGLDPYRGFYHQPRFGRPALALDMMEPFRSLVADSVVLTVINNKEVGARDFIQTPSGCAMQEQGRKSFIAAMERRLGQEVTHPIFGYKLSYRRLFEVQARLLVRHLAGEIKSYPCFVTR